MRPPRLADVVERHGTSPLWAGMRGPASHENSGRICPDGIGRNALVFVIIRLGARALHTAQRSPAGVGVTGWALLSLTSGRMPPLPPASQIELDVAERRIVRPPATSEKTCLEPGAPPNNRWRGREARSVAAAAERQHVPAALDTFFSRGPLTSPQTAISTRTSPGGRRS